MHMFEKEAAGGKIVSALGKGFAKGMLAPFLADSKHSVAGFVKNLGGPKGGKMLKMPNGTYRWTAGKDSRWYQQLTQSAINKGRQLNRSYTRDFNAGFGSKHKWLKTGLPWIASAPVVTGDLFYDQAAKFNLVPQDSPLRTALDWTSTIASGPIGWGIRGAGELANAGAQLGSYSTAYKISEGLRNTPRWQLLGGALYKDRFADQVRERAYNDIHDQLGGLGPFAQFLAENI